MRRILWILPLLLFSGCATTHPYLIISQNCNCEEIILNDHHYPVSYRFKAHYSVGEAIVTTVEIEFINQSTEDLFLDLGTVKISSRNISYQYNDKFLPLPDVVVRPSGTHTLRMVGVETAPSKDPKKELEGEQLIVVVKGLRIGVHTLDPQTITLELVTQ